MNANKRKILEDAGILYPSVVTNADRIRAMSDDELAEFICKTQFAFIPRSLGNIPIREYAITSVLEWLKQKCNE